MRAGSEQRSRGVRGRDRNVLVHGCLLLSALVPAYWVSPTCPMGPIFMMLANCSYMILRGGGWGRGGWGGGRTTSGLKERIGCLRAGYTGGSECRGQEGFCSAAEAEAAAAPCNRPPT